MTITMRTIKISLATLLSIWVASVFQLDNNLSAGIIAILSVLDTKMASVKTAFERTLSTLLALGISAVLFALFGFSVLVFGIYLMIYVPLAYRFDLQSGIPPCSVLVTHLLLAESIAFSLLLNEVLLMIIGAGIAILFNLYMPSQKHNLEELRRTIEGDMRTVLYNFNKILRNEVDPQILIDDFERLNKHSNEAYDLALEDYDNQLYNKSDYYVRYFRMRDDQITLLKQMSERLEYIHLSTKQNKTLGALFQLTAYQLHEKNTGENLFNDISLLHQHFRGTELPYTREEFESRAILYQLMLDFKQFLNIKREFSKDLYY